VKSLVTGKPQLFSIIAESNTDLLLIDKSTYLQVFQQDESNLDIILNFLLNEVRALRHIDRRCDTLRGLFCGSALCVYIQQGAAASIGSN
jgi:hypothetical protein